MERIEKRLVKMTEHLRKSPDRAYQFKICIWIALNKSTGQIIDLLRDKFKIEMSEQNIDQTYRAGKRWKPVINYLRIRYLRNISRIPIAHKAHRLALLDEAANEALSLRVKSINELGTIMEKKIGVLPAIISEARREVEGEKPGTYIDNREQIIQQYNYKDKTDVELVSDIITMITAERRHTK